MNVRGLVNWIDKNYPGLSPYLGVGSLGIEIYLDKRLRTIDLRVANLYYNKRGDSWEYVGSSGIIDKERVSRGARAMTQRHITRKNQSVKTFLNILNLMCVNVIKLIDWYEQFPIERDREYLEYSELLIKSDSLSNGFEIDDSGGISLTLSLPGASKIEYIAFIWSNNTNNNILLTAPTLEELLDKIMTGKK